MTRAPDADDDSTETSDDLATALQEAGVSLAHEGDDTIVVARDDDVISFSGVEALAERRGWFVFASDPSEITLQTYDSCPWKEQRGGVVEVPN